MTQSVLSPDVAVKQKLIHFITFSDDPEEKGNVVINLRPRDRQKSIHDYLLKLGGLLSLSFLKAKNKQLQLSSPKDKAHIDSLIKEIGLLHNGNSNVIKCKGKIFNWDEIHLKGLEFLSAELKNYLYDQLKTQFGWCVQQNNERRINFYSLQTHDNAVLDSVAFSSESEEKKPMSERKFLITCLANGQNYINWLKDFNYSAKEIGCTVIGFNYRGIDYSQGLVWTENNMIDDALAQVQLLLDQGVKAEHIGLEGMCLGAAVATLAAARAHEQQQRVKLYNERSFRSISQALAGIFFPNTNSSLWNPLSLLRYCFGGLMYVLTLPLIWLSGWQMDVASAWEKIPYVDKDYSVIRNFTDSDPNAPKEDGIIEDRWASLASLIDAQRKRALNKQQQGQYLTTDEAELVVDNPENHQFKVNPSFDRGNKVPHILARRHLIQSTNDSPIHMHQHMARGFKTKFFKPLIVDIPQLDAKQESHYVVSL